MSQARNPMLPIYMRSRQRRACPPAPIQFKGQNYDVVGVSRRKELLLRDQRTIHQDVRLEDFADRLVLLDNTCWRVISLEAILGATPLDVVPVLRMVHHDTLSRAMYVSQEDMSKVLFSNNSGEYIYKIGRIKHGIMRLSSIVPRTRKRITMRPGQQFEARLRGRELEGRFLVDVGIEDQLTAVSLDTDEGGTRTNIQWSDIAPRYTRISSLDFRAHFDVDTFAFCEDRLRSQATTSKSEPNSEAIQDPLFSTLSTGATNLRLTSGADHLAVFEQFIQTHTQPPGLYEPNGTTVTRQLFLLNLSVSNQGDARCVLEALLGFRYHNPRAKIHIVASKLGTSEFQQSPDFDRFVQILEKHNINVDDYTGSGVNRETRQVMHGKAISIDGHVLFSTGAVMDTQPINKADFSIELPLEAAKVFQAYINEAICDDAIPERRAELASNLASLGILINDPVTGIAYISRVQDALMSGAQHSLMISLSELVDPLITEMLICRAASGTDITIQVRELDRKSAQLLTAAVKQYGNIRVEDSSCWEPRPHWNAIIADGKMAYVGSSYLWSTQRNMLHQGRSFENGVLLGNEATKKVSMLIHELRHRNMAVLAPSVPRMWTLQYKFSPKITAGFIKGTFRETVGGLPLMRASYGHVSEEEIDDKVEAGKVVLYWFELHR